MLEPHREILEELEIATAKLSALVVEESDWEARWCARSADKSLALIREKSESKLDQRRASLVPRLEHLRVMNLIYQHDPASSVYDENCLPAFAMSHEDVIHELSCWLVDVVRSDGELQHATDSRRLLLGWCAQVLLTPVLVQPEPHVLDADIEEAAHSIYGYATSAQPIEGERRQTGRDAPDPRLMLAYASFPFLEGIVRRACSDYLTPMGRVVAPFEVLGRLYSPDRPRPVCSNLAHGLELLEARAAGKSLQERLILLRREVAAGGVGPRTSGVSGDEKNLYKIIFIHRNSNLHGGSHVAHVGLAALLLATIIAFDRAVDSYEERQDIALEIAKMAPLDPKMPWRHVVYYPVRFFNSYESLNTHRFPDS